MNVKIKARVAILKHYMTLLGFKDPTITARIAPVFGGAAYTFKGKEEIELERLEQAARQYPGSFNTEVVITIRGHHTGTQQRALSEPGVPSGVHPGVP